MWMITYFLPITPWEICYLSKWGEIWCRRSRVERYQRKCLQTNNTHNTLPTAPTLSLRLQASSHACMLNCFSWIWLGVTIWPAAHQAPLSTGFSRQEYWSGLPFPSPSPAWGHSYFRILWIWGVCQLSPYLISLHLSSSTQCPLEYL